MSLNSENQGWFKTSSRVGLLCLFFSRSPNNVLKKRKLTLADVLSLFGNFFPGVEGEIGRVVNSLSSNLSVIFVIEGEHSAQEEVDDYSD